MQVQHTKYQRAIRAYILGDNIGSVFETNAPCSTFRRMKMVEILKRAKGKCHSTDETDIVLMLDQFTHSYGKLKDKDDFLLKWSIFSAHNYQSVRYGKTFPDFFRLVKFLEKRRTLQLSILYDVAKDRNSMGNGCLAAVYPLFHYLDVNGLDIPEKIDFILDFTRLTHHHPNALSAVTLLICILDVLISDREIRDLNSYTKYEQHLRQFTQAQNRWANFLMTNIDLIPNEFLIKHPINLFALETLLYAMYGLKNSKELLDTIGCIVSLGGDVDSILSLAMMLGAFYYGESESSTVLRYLAESIGSTAIPPIYSLR